MVGYTHLQDFISSVKESCKHPLDHSVGCTEESGLEIITFLESIRDRTWKNIKSTLSTYVSVVTDSQLALTKSYPGSFSLPQSG